MDLNVTEAELGELTPIEEPLRQIAAPELVADATAVPAVIGRKPSGELPEASALKRGEPDLFDLVGETTPEVAPQARKHA